MSSYPAMASRCNAMINQKSTIHDLYTRNDTGEVVFPVVKYATIALALGRWRSSTAEQRFCKPQVGGSIPLASSTPRLRDRALRSTVRGYSIPPVSVQSAAVQRRRSGARGE